jgi:hypothetical protein
MLRKEVNRILLLLLLLWKGHGFLAVKEGGGDFYVKLSSAIVMCSRMKDIYVARGEDQWRELK